MAKLAVMLAVGLGFGGAAADAAATSLTVTVSPTTLHPGVHYRVTIAGSYTERSHAKPPYLLAFIQYSGKPCQRSATAEYTLPASEWDWEIFPQQAETHPTFKDVAYWKAGSRLGTRHLCAYLYASEVTPSTKAQPLARASTSFSNSKR